MKDRLARLGITDINSGISTGFKRLVRARGIDRFVFVRQTTVA